MVMVDSTVWVDFLRGQEFPQTRIIVSLLEDDDICICGPVLTEVLQGIMDAERYQKINSLFSSLVYLPIERGDYLLAATIYRAARVDGKTIRRTMDCVIAACAITHQISLLHRDRDFDVIAHYSKLRCFTSP